MINVLFIGKYDAFGKFNRKQWHIFLEWCKLECNRIIIYTRMSYEKFIDIFCDSCYVKLLEKPDKYLNIHAFEINVKNDIFWKYLMDCNFNIDFEENISHIYFFYNKNIIASLEIVDYENYIMIEESALNTKKIDLDVELSRENINMCLYGRDDIDDFLDGEQWKALI